MPPPLDREGLKGAEKEIGSLIEALRMHRDDAVERGDATVINELDNTIGDLRCANTHLSNILN